MVAAIGFAVLLAGVAELGRRGFFSDLADVYNTVYWLWPVAIGIVALATAGATPGPAAGLLVLLGGALAMFGIGAHIIDPKSMRPRWRRERDDDL